MDDCGGARVACIVYQLAERGKWRCIVVASESLKGWWGLHLYLYFCCLGVNRVDFLGFRRDTVTYKLQSKDAPSDAFPFNPKVGIHLMPPLRHSSLFDN
jgi:hypothetical protein